MNYSPGANPIKFFYGHNLLIFRDKLECLSLASLSSLVKCLRVRSKPTRVKRLTRGLTLSLTRKHYIGLEWLSTDKHSSLVRKVVTYVRKKLYNIGSRFIMFSVPLFKMTIPLMQLFLLKQTKMGEIKKPFYELFKITTLLSLPHHKNNSSQTFCL